MNDASLIEAARLFGILSEPSRLRLIQALMPGPLTVGELVTLTGMKQGNASKQLGILLTARFLAREKEGNFARYRIADAKLYALCDLMCGRIEDDAARRLHELMATSAETIAISGKTC